MPFYHVQALALKLNISPLLAITSKIRDLNRTHLSRACNSQHSQLSNTCSELGHPVQTMVLSQPSIAANMCMSPCGWHHPPPPVPPFRPMQSMGTAQRQSFLCSICFQKRTIWFKGLTSAEPLSQFWAHWCLLMSNQMVSNLAISNLKLLLGPDVHSPASPTRCYLLLSIHMLDSEMELLVI